MGVNCNNKTAKNKGSSIPDISNGKAVLRGNLLKKTVVTVHWSLLKQQDLDTVIIIKVSTFMGNL